MQKLIAETTHVLENSSGCIDIIFTNQPNLIMYAAVHPSLQSQCCHQGVYAKLNWQIEYPPSYTHQVWGYSKAQVDLINKAVGNFD